MITAPSHFHIRVYARLGLALLSLSASGCSADSFSELLSNVMPRFMRDPAKAPAATEPASQPDPTPPQADAPAAIKAARPSTVHGGPAAVHGRLVERKATEIIARHQNELRFCHESQTATPDDVQLELKILVSPKGAVQEAVVEKSDSNDSNFDRCIADAARRWTFPAPGGDGVAVVNYPVRLTRTAE